MESYIDYLRRLKAWGEALKENVQAERLSQLIDEKWLKKLDDFLNKIEEHIAKQEVSYEEVRLLQNKGKTLSNLIKTSNTEKAIPYGKHKLPALPYAYDALEPYISKEIMKLHHEKHHQSYVDGLNKAEEELYVKKADSDTMKHWLREQAFHGSGHYLHSIFWNNMTPNSSKQPIKEVQNKIDNDFGSWQKFKKLFSDAANSVEGVGWAVLSWSPISGKLAIQTFEKHQLFQVANTIPLLVLDMWEHAYYLQYQTNKGKYIDNWWNVVNWENVNNRYLTAIKIHM
ncbi:superoxide dismutase [Oceanobacillus halophilus]|uniref:superoxide dismutase n=1 Tax=Oceanobacillus halophilus TaxID=930130 RepID=A0A495ADY0_9BACI|nr:superoxide dismutase [Oceanobacillus halophilus]RKQ37704.1 superoxide dismutase [Oceanobacillus halophilus]